MLNLALYVLGITLGLEAIGAAALWLRWRTVMPDGLAAWMAIFHAISEDDLYAIAEAWFAATA